MKTLLAMLGLAACLSPQSNDPAYIPQGLVNGATFQPGLAPNTIATLFGTNLSWNTEALAASDMNGGQMPTKLGGVEVIVAGYPARLYYVSPSQVNLLIPSYLRPGTVGIWLVRDGTAGPVIQLTVNTAGPALFQTPDGHAIATHLDNSLVTPEAPASAGEVIVLYVTGLGWVYPAGMGWTYAASSGWTPVAQAACISDGIVDGVLPVAAQWLCNMDQFGVWLSDTAIDSGLILYAGVTPGYAGLYQVNFRMPEQFAPNPEIRLALGSAVSPAGILLPAR